jgi:predicted small secreted protein
MNFANYFKTRVNKGEVVSKLFQDLHKEKQFKNILCIRTPTTGSWMDTMFSKNTKSNITRIMYAAGSMTANSYMKRLYTVVEYSDLESHIRGLNLQFDIICIDPFHEYNESANNFSILPLFLTDDGIIISHDCYPPVKEWATPKFKGGGWCGVTYVAFVEFAYNNPDWYYTILNNDTGIGIMSKKPMTNLKNSFNRELQKQLIDMYKAGDNKIYDFFSVNSGAIINAINA